MGGLLSLALEKMELATKKSVATKFIRSPDVSIRQGRAQRRCGEGLQREGPAGSTGRGEA